MRPVVRSGIPPLIMEYDMTVEAFLKWKILPRFMMLMSTLMSWRCAEWFMELPDPSGAQSAFVSVVMGVMTGVFGIWMGHEHRGD